MANELWISDVTGLHGWTVDSKGNVSDEAWYDPMVRQVLSIGVEEPFTRKQADAVRELIAELVEADLLDEYPSKGVQYPTGTHVDHWEPTMRYLRSWPDDTDATTTADTGLSTECPWIPPQEPEPEPEATIQEGDENGLVLEWQAICNEILMDTETEENYFLEVDGKFGPETRKTTKLVQSTLNIPTTGTVDETTWQAL